MSNGYIAALSEFFLYTGSVCVILPRVFKRYAQKPFQTPLYTIAFERNVDK
jgi:hypothetical protein